MSQRHLHTAQEPVTRLTFNVKGICIELYTKHKFCILQYAYLLWYKPSFFSSDYCENKAKDNFPFSFFISFNTSHDLENGWRSLNGSRSWTLVWQVELSIGYTQSWWDRKECPITLPCKQYLWWLRAVKSQVVWRGTGSHWHPTSLGREGSLTLKGAPSKVSWPYQ